MKYFEMKEFERSTTAVRLGIENDIPFSLKPNIRLLVNKVLDPIREHIKIPVYVNSGYRSPLLNKAVGGVPGSQHVIGQAADITTHIRNADLEIINYVKGNIVFDQMIIYKNFIHISYRGWHDRKQIIYNGK